MVEFFIYINENTNESQELKECKFPHDLEGIFIEMYFK